MDKIDILSLELFELEEKFLELGEKKFRASQVFEWLHSKNVLDFNDFTNISVQLRDKCFENFCTRKLKIVKKLESSIDYTVKYLYELFDGNYIETVLMKYNHGYSLCVSTQVGCKMGCKFCASTRAGFVRNLSASEILLQLYQTQLDAGVKISSIVLMGIGEPLDNFDNVVKFLKILSHKKGTNMSLRHVSLSTCGLVDKIDELAKMKLGLTLSISLHSTNNASRSEIMPINNRYNISKLINSCKNYIKLTGRRISFEYAVIQGVNDTKEFAYELANLLKGMICHVNLIPVNEIEETDFKSTKKSALQFQQYLVQSGVNATIRRTLGADINAACGQLRREYQV